MTTRTGPTLTEAPPTRSKARAPLLTLGLLAAAVVVTFCALALASALARDHANVDRAWSGGEHGVLIETDGAVTVVGGADGEVGLHSHLTWSWRKPSVVGESLRDGTFRIRVHCHDVPAATIGCSTASTVTVPGGTSVRVVGSDGSVSATHLSGPLDLSTGDGNVHLEDVSGPLRLHTADGSVHADTLASGQVTASTGDGSLHLDFVAAPTRATLRTADGSIAVTLPRHTADGAYRVTTRTADGNVSVGVQVDTLATKVVDASTGDGNISIQYSDSS